jgi:hypothetical protein
MRALLLDLDQLRLDSGIRDSDVIPYSKVHIVPTLSQPSGQLVGGCRWALV